MMIQVIDLPNESASVSLATSLALCLMPPLMLTFSGEIGTGKTTLIRAMLRSLGITSSIKSPTFSLIESYQCGSLQLHHFDLYRIQDERELDYIGFRDYFSSDSVCCIEWPERVVHGFERQPDIAFTITIKGAGRKLRAQALTTAGMNALSGLALPTMTS